MSTRDERREAWWGARHPLMVFASSEQLWPRTVAWAGAALLAGDKVLYLSGTKDPQRRTAERLAATLGAVTQSDQFEIVEVPSRAVTTTWAIDDRRAWIADTVRQGLRSGFSRVAVVNEAVHRTPRPATTDQVAGWLAAESALSWLVASGRVRVLCRYHESVLPRGPLRTVLRGHSRHVEDVDWGVQEIGGRLCLHGELDDANVERFRDVLQAAIAAGRTVVDLAGVTLLSATAMGVLSSVAADLHDRGGVLVIADPAPLTAKAMRLARLLDHPGLRVVATGTAPLTDATAGSAVGAARGPATGRRSAGTAGPGRSG